ncbi:hypothetical protein D3C72_1862960 [compost metagenome]
MPTTRIGERPLARANFTQSCGSTSRTPARVRRITSEILNSDRLMAGSSMCRRPSSVRNDHCAPRNSTVWPRPLEGSMPSDTLKVMISIRPTQNVGSEKPTMLPAMTDLENQFSGYSPAKRPSGAPSSTASISAAMASSSVAGRRCRMSSMAGTL